MKLRRTRRKRKGMGTVEWVIVAGAIALVVVGAVSMMGTRVDGEMSQTAEDVADPARLTQRFGN